MKIDRFARNFITTIDKISWFRVKERETKRYPALLHIGDRVQYSKIIARCGYYFQPGDMPINLENSVAENILAEKVADDFEVRSKNIPKEIQSIITQAVIKALDNGGAMRHIRYLARAKWLGEQKKNFPDANLRTMFYIDLERPREGIITKRVARWIGEQYSSSSSYTYYGEYDYEPGGLENAIYQQIYGVSSDGSEYYTDWVHPLDIQ